ncbi:MAG: hypothetical protein IKI93_08190 [Clostridia bacterium]|nr:hypothetical protein [Clostridia bacterium]
MKYIPETGILYDTIAYLTAYYADGTEPVFADSDDDAFFASLPPMPKLLAPFSFAGKTVPHR